MERKNGLFRHHGMNDSWFGDDSQDTSIMPIVGLASSADSDLAVNAAPVAAGGSIAAAAQNGTSLSPTTDGLNMVHFMTGLDGSGALDTAHPDYWNWNKDTPATYTLNTIRIAHEWTPGSTVSYWFNPASNWTAAEQASFTEALNLWSAIANIHFAESISASNAIDITRGNDGAANTNATYSFSNAIGMGLITSATTSIDTNGGGWTALDSFSVTGGYGRETVLHELGHAIGLGHPGPYDGSTPSASQVLYTSDTRQYSVMSYVNPGSALADAVAANNGDTPSPASYSGYYLTTPGQYDILAIQRLYGAPVVSTPLTVGETFGFNASAILTSSMPQFDFTVNTSPVVTIYDSGTGNVLDLSGFSLASTVDLNPGQFSSANGMIDNIGIAFDTSIDGAVGGSGDDTFYVNAQADTIDGGGGTDTVAFAGNRATYKLARTDTTTITVTNGGITDTLSNIEALQFADQNVATSDVPCFVRGTRILTPSGEVAVETLNEGDEVCTGTAGTRPVTWIGSRTIDLTAHPRPWAVSPIRITRAAFGDGQPRRDLLLSPDHAVLLGAVLIPVKLLVNGCTIVHDRSACTVTYVHVELDRHDIISAEGLAVESYLDTGNRRMFANSGTDLILHPDFTVRASRQSWEFDACAPLAIVGQELEAARVHLSDRAASLGWSITNDPCLRLAIGDREIFPAETVSSARAVFVLPAGLQHFCIRSRICIPAAMRQKCDDPRPLGVSVTRMAFTSPDGGHHVPVDHPGLHNGWYQVERKDHYIWRWTNGEALVPLPSPTAASTVLELEHTGHLPYWIAD